MSSGVLQGFARVSGAFEGMPDWPAGLLLSLGPWSALFVSIQVLAVRLYAWTLRDGFRADFR